ncbi:MAG TPA: AMP nucleosidase, partial [Aliiroseovarius sp.]|nr:AMP nucleosidase [Aliiroseovarius sp.]
MPASGFARKILTPASPGHEAFDDARAAVDRLTELYDEARAFLRTQFARTMAGELPQGRVRAFYPEIRVTVTSHAQIDSRLSFGHVAGPGSYATTITRPDLFRNYLIQQIGLLVENHGVPVLVGPSVTPIPVHFAIAGDDGLSVPHDGAMDFPLRDVFDVPDLDTTNDDIVNGVGFRYEDGALPLAPFTAQRVDYSLARLAHYTATDPGHFQNHVLFTNYQFYVEEFEQYARKVLGDPDSGYTAFVGTANATITSADGVLPVPDK